MNLHFCAIRKSLQYLQVMAQVSCDVTVPKDTRPNEGSIVVNVELSPMAAPHFEAGRPSDESVCSFIRCIIVAFVAGQVVIYSLLFNKHSWHQLLVLTSNC